MSLEDQVRAELLSIRKRPDGLSLASMSASPVLCGLLGDGDPVLALSQLRLAILDAEPSLGLTAVASSLGLTSEQPTHLGRLEDFGTEHGYDQRQARRYSDRGIRELARLIASNLAVTSVPCLDLLVVQAAPDAVDVMIATKRLWFIEMQPVHLTLRQGEDEPAMPDPGFIEADEDAVARSHTAEPLRIRVAAESSLTLVWRGELWPKFSVTWAEGRRDGQATVEALGNKLMLRVWPTQ